MLSSLDAFIAESEYVGYLMTDNATTTIWLTLNVVTVEYTGNRVCPEPFLLLLKKEKEKS